MRRTGNPLTKRETLQEYNYRLRQEAIQLLKTIKEKSNEDITIKSRIK
jgi:hypothetical protein